MHCGYISIPQYVHTQTHVRRREDERGGRELHKEGGAMKEGRVGWGVGFT